MNGFNYLKQMQHFDANNSHKKGKDEKERKKHLVHNFSEYVQYYQAT